MAMHNLGVVHRDGLGVRKNARLAFGWFMRAARLGDADSALQVIKLAKEHDLEHDRRVAVRWLRVAARSRHAPSQERLGRMLFHGLGVRRNRPEALRWYRRAARQDDPHALCALGIHHHNETGVEQDWAKSARLYRKAADQGLPWAMYLLGLCYRDGEGVARDRRRARHWFNKAIRTAGEDDEETLKEARAALAEMRSPGAAAGQV